MHACLCKTKWLSCRHRIEQTVKEGKRYLEAKFLLLIIMLCENLFVTRMKVHGERKRLKLMGDFYDVI